MSCSHNHHHNNHHRFKDAQYWTKKFDAPERSSYQKPLEIIQLMELKDTDRVADIGAGTGYMLPYFNSALKNGVIYGLDVEQELISFMNERIQKDRLLRAKSELIGFDDPALTGKKINKVFILNTWHHIEKQGDYAKKIFTQIQKNGEIYLVESEPGKGGPGPHHRIMAEAVMKPFRDARFKCGVLNEKLAFHYMIKCLK